MSKRDAVIYCAVAVVVEFIFGTMAGGVAMGAMFAGFCGLTPSVFIILSA